ncbi:MAG TPA: TerB family tellurite resistance protein [Mariprofundaceae bacterium]|nr:TerB family tellurite resistance protein [Mariprofundaceae bacterium]
MLKKLKTLWDGTADKKPGHRKHEISLAVTAVMVEIMHIDGKLDDAEHDTIIKTVEKRFDLSTDEVKKLLEEARQATANASDLHQFTSQIIKHYKTEERIEIIKELWQVAMADGHIDPHEESLIRRTAELIGVYHREYVQAKIDARKES